MSGYQYLNKTITEYNHKVQEVKVFAALLVIISRLYIFFFSGIYTANSFYQKEMKIRTFIYARIRKLLPTLLLVVLLSVLIMNL